MTAYIPTLAEFAYAKLSAEECALVGRQFGYWKFQISHRCAWCNGYGAKYLMKLMRSYVDGKMRPALICKKCFDEEVIMVPIPYDVIGRKPVRKPEMPIFENDDVDKWLNNKFNWQCAHGIDYPLYNARANPDGATYIWKLFDGSYEKKPVAGLRFYKDGSV